MSEVIINGAAVLGISFLMSLAMILIRRRFSSQEQFAQMQEEVKRWNSDRDRAKKTGDKKLAAKLRKQEKMIAQLQKKMLRGQLISFVTTFALLFGIWPVLIFFFGDAIVAYVPFSVPLLEAQPPYPLRLLAGGWPLWYIICSYFSSSILQRVFGIGMTLTMQPQK